MISSRETVYSSVFAILQTLAPAHFVTVSRRLDNFANVPPIFQPALYQLQAMERISPRRGMPPVNQLELELFIYARTDDPTFAPSQFLNPLLDAVFELFEPNPAKNTTVTQQWTNGATLTQTFGIPGVEHIWVEGEIKIAEGCLENQAIAVIPVSIKTL